MCRDPHWRWQLGPGSAKQSTCRAIHSAASGQLRQLGEVGCSVQIPVILLPRPFHCNGVTLGSAHTSRYLSFLSLVSCHVHRPFQGDCRRRPRFRLPLLKGFRNGARNATQGFPFWHSMQVVRTRLSIFKMLLWHL